MNRIVCPNINDDENRKQDIVNHYNYTKEQTSNKHCIPIRNDLSQYNYTAKTLGLPLLPQDGGQDLLYYLRDRVHFFLAATLPRDLSPERQDCE